jgi:hypothetical protein
MGNDISGKIELTSFDQDLTPPDIIPAVLSPTLPDGIAAGDLYARAAVSAQLAATALPLG